MSLRALVLGFLLAMLVAVGGHFNDVYMYQTYMVGNHFPVSVMGLLVVLVLVVNPLLRRMRLGRMLRSAELAVIVALPLAACVVPGSGFLRTLTPTLVLPIHYEKMIPSWQKNQVLDYAPHTLMAGGAEDSEEIVGSFLQGKYSPTGGHIGLRDVPWAGWLPALSRWLPLFLLLMFGLIGLALVLHRQWVHHEHLVYPIAEFVRMLGSETSEPGAPATGPVWQDRVFWYGFVPVFLLHLVNGLHAWFPTWLEIPHRIDISPFRELLPGLVLSRGGGGLFYGTLYFSVIAFAYFLRSDVTLSLGLCPLATVLFATGATTYGITMTSSRVEPTEIQGLLFGAYFGMAAFILFNGRSYYSRVLAAAFGRRTAGDRPALSAVWGCRAFLLCAALATVLSGWMGLDWPFALLNTFLLVLMFVVMSRICVETGLFFLAPEWLPIAVLAGFLGPECIGPHNIAVLTLIGVILAVDPREAMMPFVTNALRMVEDVRVAKGRTAIAMGGTLLVGTVAGLVVVLWLQYDRGVGLIDQWATRRVPQMTFNAVDRNVQILKAEDQLEAAEQAGMAQRFAAVRPTRGFVGFFAVGLALLLACAVMRLRFSRWPLHPVLFLVWFTWNGSTFAWSFMVGWFVKALVVRYGGGKTYRRLKPAMLGVIAGEMGAGLLFMLVGAVYYFLTGLPPERYAVFPR